MNAPVVAPPVPLRKDENNVLLVGNTRIPIDTVVYAFNQGASPEDIVMSYPALSLTDVYAVINYYLHKRDEIDNYICKREMESDKIRNENEKRFPPEGIRTKLLNIRQQ